MKSMIQASDAGLPAPCEMAPQVTVDDNAQYKIVFWVSKSPAENGKSMVHEQSQLLVNFHDANDLSEESKKANLREEVIRSAMGVIGDSIAKSLHVSG